MKIRKRHKKTVFRQIQKTFTPKSDGLSKKLALGATGIAVTAAAIATGAALVNKKLRLQLVRNSQKILSAFSNTSKVGHRRYQTYAHELISRRKAKSSRIHSKRPR